MSPIQRNLLYRALVNHLAYRNSGALDHRRLRRDCNALFEAANLQGKVSDDRATDFDIQVVHHLAFEALHLQINGIIADRQSGNLVISF